VVVDRNGKKTIKLDQIKTTEQIFDVGLPSIKALSSIISTAGLILWNGPLGWYEYGYSEATECLLKMIAQSKAESIIGGGDTATLINEMKLEKKFSFVSTGGGATLDFLANGTLPGIKALK
jgi:phosphoglycerate kinase